MGPSLGPAWAHDGPSLGPPWDEHIQILKTYTMEVSHLLNCPKMRVATPLAHGSICPFRFPWATWAHMGAHGPMGHMGQYGRSWAHGPHGPIWALMGPYGSFWAHGPHGTIWALLGQWATWAHMGPFGPGAHQLRPSLSVLLLDPKQTRKLYIILRKIVYQ
jgi:hypothetical protein